MRVGRLVVGVIVMLAVGTDATSQELETETARLPATGTIVVAGGVEYQTSSEGSELATPLVVEAGLSRRWEIMVEPVAYTAIRPFHGPAATGPGDLEATMIGRT